jgi:hypothetical protein
VWERGFEHVLSTAPVAMTWRQAGVGVWRIECGERQDDNVEVGTRIKGLCAVAGER